MEHEAALVASKVTLAGGVSLGAIGWFTVTEWMAIFGAICALGGWLSTHYYSRKTYNLKERELQARIDGIIK